MRPFLIALLAFSAVAGPAAAETRYLAYDASDRVTQAMTRGITLEVDRGLFGAVSVRRIISTSASLIRPSSNSLRKRRCSPS